MEELIKELSTKYANCDLKESYRDGNKVLLYNNSNLEWDEEFIDTVLNLAMNQYSW